MGNHTLLRLARCAGLALLLFPSAFAGDTDRGVELFKQKEYGKAAQELREALAADANDQKAGYYLSLSLIELGEFDQAEEQLNRLEAREEARVTPSEMKTGRARVLIGREDYAGADKLLVEATTLDPENLDAHLRRSELALRRKDYPLATAEAEEVLKRKPDEAYAHYYAGIAYSNMRRADKMVDHFQRFLKLAPDAPEAAKVTSLLRSLRR